MTRFLVSLGALLVATLAWPETADEVQLTTEEQRLTQACRSVATYACTPPHSFSLTATESPLSRARAIEVGTQLWRHAQHAPDSATPDDRALYWQRLATLAAYKRHQAKKTPQAQNPPASRATETASIAAFEAASRGLYDLTFQTDADLKVLITGFDPFNLDRNLHQSNPSGAAAMVLDGLVLSSNGVSVELQSVLFPVRFADFDNGMVEQLVDQHLLSNQLDGLISISMGREGFDLERFPGRRRSAKAPDNLGVFTGGSSATPVLPLLQDAPLAGPEFVEFNLPVASLMSVQAPFPVTDNRRVRTLQAGWQDAPSLEALAGAIAVSGSGGGYLSNEISYRAVLRSQRSPTPLIVGHIHTPRVAGYDAHANHAIAEQITLMLQRSVTAMAQLRSGAGSP